MKNKILLLLMSCIFLLGLSLSVLAEVAPATEQKITPDDFLSNPGLPFTGTLSDEDMDNVKEEPDLFGPEEEEITTPTEERLPTHLLRFEFVGKIQFIDNSKKGNEVVIVEEPYMEVRYTTKFEVPLSLSDHRENQNVEAEYDIDSWGFLAHNEFFDCKLDIALKAMPVEISTKVQTTPGDETTEPKKAFILKVGFNNNISEDWFSFCTDVSGAKLNTQGDTEEYNFMLLKAIEPSLSSILVDDFNPDDKTKINLSVKQKTVNDLDVANDIVLSGEGAIFVEPY